jgi:hypothetical protein
MTGGGGGTTSTGAPHAAVDPRNRPTQLQVQGPVPSTVEALPALQSDDVGAEVTATPFAAPQTPLIGVGLPRAIVGLAASSRVRATNAMYRRIVFSLFYATTFVGPAAFTQV